MHIPDGFINIATAASTYAASTGAIAYAVKATGKQLSEKRVPLMGVMAAFIFAAQLFDFPLLGGTSGHFLGAALAAILLGPWAGLLVMSCVLIIQSLLLQDGGIIALGANIFNMGVIGCLAGYLIYRGVSSIGRESRAARLAGSFLGGWFSITAAALATTGELAISSVSPQQVMLPVIGSIYAVIGLVEGAITAAAVSLVLTARPDLILAYRLAPEKGD